MPSSGTISRRPPIRWRVLKAGSIHTTPHRKKAGTSSKHSWPSALADCGAVGFGRSLQKLYYLPVQHADFIFPVIAEEFGLMGCIVLISLFGLFGYYGFKTAMDSRTMFGRLLAIGITSSITLQAIVNIAVTTGLVPVTGITLPFISYGGTSIVSTLAMVGILLSISRDRGQIEEDDEFAADSAT